MSDSAFQEAEDLIGEIYEIIEENEFPDRAEEFVASVQAGAEDIDAWINDNSRVTDKQLTALENWRNGLKEWVPETTTT